MADVSYLISLGVGAPADVPHFVLVGLSPTGVIADVDGDILTTAPAYLRRATTTGSSCLRTTTTTANGER